MADGCYLENLKKIAISLQQHDEIWNDDAEWVFQARRLSAI